MKLNERILELQVGFSDFQRKRFNFMVAHLFNLENMKDNPRFLYYYFLVTFAWTWMFALPLVLAARGIINIPMNGLSGIALPLLVVSVFGPLMGALFAVRREHGKGAPGKYLRTFLDLRLGWKTYILAILILGGTTAVAWLIPEFFGAERLPMLLPSGWIFLPYLLLMIFFGGGQEEFGWRGYALPRMEKRLGLWLANILLGIMWALWHLPLWFIPGTSQTYMHFGGFILLTVGYSFLFSWIREISGNRPFSGLFVHGVANAFVPLTPVIVLQLDVPQPRFWLWVCLTFLVGVFITILRTLPFRVK